MITMYKRGRVFHVRGSLDGVRVRRTLGTTDRRVAEHRKREIEMDILGGARRVEWDEFEKRFWAWIEHGVKPSTIRKYQFVISRFARFLNFRNIRWVHRIDTDTISSYLEERKLDLHPTKKIPVGREGQKSDLRILHRVFAFAVECGYISKNPVRYRNLNTIGGKTLPFSRDELERMLNEPTTLGRPDLRAILLTFIYTGLRISDVISLEKKAVDWKREQIIVKTRKRGTVVHIGLHPDLASTLKTHLASLSGPRAESSLMFPSSTGKPLVSLDAYLRRLWRRAGIENAHAHRFRDTFAVRLLEQGASLYDVAKMLGITAAVAERHYTPYVRELQERGQRLVSQLQSLTQPEHSRTAEP